jgi:copper chaperone NosL
MRNACRERLTLLALLALAAACSPAGPRAIAAGDQCGYCRMEVTDARFGAQVVTTTGKVQLFDSIECMAGYLRGADSATMRGAWVADVDHPAQWVPVAEAGYLVGSELRGPMGHVIAFASPVAAQAAQARLGGSIASWDAVRTDSAGVAAHAAGGH